MNLSMESMDSLNSPDHVRSLPVSAAEPDCIHSDGVVHRGGRDRGRRDHEGMAATECASNWSRHGLRDRYGPWPVAAVSSANGIADAAADSAPR